jgi:hypothetical protein
MYNGGGGGGGVPGRMLARLALCMHHLNPRCMHCIKSCSFHRMVPPPIPSSRLPFNLRSYLPRWHALTIPKHGQASLQTSWRSCSTR